MKKNFDVNIVRLRSGEDIIAFCSIDPEDSSVQLRYPQTFYVSYDTDIEEEEITLVDWLPRSAFGYQEATIPVSEVLFITSCTLEFGNKYLKSLLDFIDPDTELSKSIQETLSESSEPNTTLH
jgi:hypothetical protein